MMSDSLSSPPDGIGDRHSRVDRWTHRHANPTSLILTGLLLTIACLGLLGGKPHPVLTRSEERARLTVASPAILRNGMFFETRILIEPLRPIDDVVLAVSADLWRDVTINTAIPAAEKEESADGMIRMSFGPGERGKPIAIKFDGQVNPPLVGRASGEIAVYDGDHRLAAIPLTMRVLP